MQMRQLVLLYLSITADNGRYDSHEQSFSHVLFLSFVTELLLSSASPPDG